eukprot:COSAG02_NODE_10480_length_1932_cov_2.028914_2_plen_313_part_00
MNASITAVSGIAPILSGCLDGNFTHAINATQHADVVVLALGLTSGSGAASSVHLDGPDWHTSVKACATTSEGEGHDRMDIQLPSGQRGLLEAVLAHKPPRTKVIVVLFNGGGLAIDDLMATDSGVSAIIEAFYPGVAGAMSLSEQLFDTARNEREFPCGVFNLTIFSARVRLKVAPIPGGAGKTVGQRTTPLWLKHLAPSPCSASVFHEYFSTPRRGIPQPPTVAPSPVMKHFSARVMRPTRSRVRVVVESLLLQKGSLTEGLPGRQPCDAGVATGGGGGGGPGGGPAHRTASEWPAVALQLAPWWSLGELL